MDILFNKTKIVATVGPASNTKEKLAQLIMAGVDVFRLNFSHGNHDQHLQVINFVRELNQEMGTNIALLQDLQGPKIRIEEMENNGVEIFQGQKIVITTEKVLGNAELVSTSYKALPNDVKIGDMVLIDDGNLELKVIDKTEKEVHCEVVYGGILRSRKGINLPFTDVTAPSLPEKDRLDLIFGLEHKVDWVALSFVRTAEDVAAVQAIIRQKDSDTKLIAKIETPQGVKNIDAIIEVSDGIMVARGDLGVEMPMEQVPIIQKTLVQKCNIAAKPVIVATQMLESMKDNPRPTRAETSDVANAVMEGADAVMLSAESASGKYPVEAVKSMTRIIKTVEDNMDVYGKTPIDLDENSVNFNSDRVVSSAVDLAESTKSKVICALTSSGRSAFVISKHRPKANIFIFTRHTKLLCRLNLLWGVRTIFYERTKSTDETIEEIKNILVKQKHLSLGDAFVTVASTPITDKRHINTIKLTLVE